MKISISRFSILLFVLSCQKQESAFKALLVKEESCWVYHPRPEDESAAVFNFCTKFSVSQGFFSTVSSFRTFYIKDDGLSEASSIDGHNPYKGNWSFSDQDSVFSIEGNEFKIIRYNQDTIIFKTQQGHMESLIRMK